LTTPPPPPPINLHATAIAYGERALLITGASGSGKSDLALRLLAIDPASLDALGIELPAPRLLADDQVIAERHGGHVHLTTPPSIAGCLEARGVGLVTLPYVSLATLALVVAATAPEHVERLPQPRTVAILGLEVPALSLDLHAASAPLKVLLALSRL
jgi:serine kinase of HPr protein (carbohydrate metabolism regulator)